MKQRLHPDETEIASGRKNICIRINSKSKWVKFQKDEKIARSNGSTQKTTKQPKSMIDNKFKPLKTKSLFLIVYGIFAFPHWGFGASQWEKQTHDFGKISEDAPSQQCTFTYANDTGKPVLITGVTTGCGCTAAEYPKGVIPPGKKASLEVSFDPAGRPGVFRKSVVVAISGQETKHRLFISGEVIKGKERKHKAYAYLIGDLQLKTKQVRFKANLPRKQYISIQVINSGQDTLRPLMTTSVPYLTAEMLPAVLAPGQRGELEISCSKQTGPSDQALVLSQWPQISGLKQEERTIWVMVE